MSVCFSISFIMLALVIVCYPQLPTSFYAGNPSIHGIGRISVTSQASIFRRYSHLSFRGASTFVRNVTATRRLYHDILGLRQHAIDADDNYASHTVAVSLAEFLPDPTSVFIRFSELPTTKRFPVNPEQENRAFVGIGYRLTKRKGIFHTFRKEIASVGGRIALNIDNYSYAASMFPEEEDYIRVPVRFGIIEDTDSNLIEIAHYQSNCTRAKISIQVLDIDESIEFYKKMLNMTLIRKRFDVISNPPLARGIVYMGYGSELSCFILEFVYNYSVLTLDHSIPVELCFEASDLDHFKSHVQSVAPNLKLESDPTRKISFRDPSGHKVTVLARGQTL